MKLIAILITLVFVYSSFSKQLERTMEYLDRLDTLMGRHVKVTSFFD